ncbi:hypothetical protein B0H17DRAFT_1144535 [Mycena rosella]|uniref:3'-5' exonuclease n=1 Tax=Mycena rosella TaxID=1033263 RepID=A0AAD7G3B6_MYCRO|nr:hypothetical protein B0H17DRAFT_1144535 [Mycena rosella]
MLALECVPSIPACEEPVIQLNYNAKSFCIFLGIVSRNETQFLHSTTSNGAPKRFKECVRPQRWWFTSRRWPETKKKQEKAVSKKVLGKRKARNDDDEEASGSSSRRRGVAPSRSPEPAATPTTKSDHEPPAAQVVKPLKIHPLFEPRSYQRNSSGTSTPNIPSLPYIPSIIPNNDLASADSIPPEVLEPAKAAARLNILLDDIGEDTNDPPAEQEPDPQGIVQAYLLETMLAIKDHQLKPHKQPDCYRIGKTFWIRPPNRWFALETHKSTAMELAPDTLYCPDIFVWLPKAGILTRLQDGLLISINVTTFYQSTSDVIHAINRAASTYEDKILAQLPKHLANEFPAFLTHCSGIDKNLVTLIRSSVAQGLTPHAWERILRELHVQNRDLAEQSYLHALKHCRPSQLPSTLTPFSSFADREGFAGHVKPHQDQAMAAVPLTIAKWDQSYKVIKYIVRLNGVRVFGSLWMMTNEFEQIRQMIFTPTQHLHRIEHPLQDVVRSLHEHGHQPVSLVWTDNLKADHLFAERIIPTLRVRDTLSLINNTSYPAVEIPQSLTVHTASSELLICNACSTIMSAIGDETTGKTISVGFSIQWDWQASQAGHFPAAMMQIVTSNIVYLLQIYKISDPAKVPETLKALLFSNRVIKVGYHVQGDLDILALLWDLKKSHTKESGWVDIGVLAKSKGLIPSPSASFLKISEAVLRRNINSLQEVRLSDWCREDLSDDQKEYAIRNAWVAHKIYKAIVDRPPSGAWLSWVGLLGDRVTLRNEHTLSGSAPAPEASNSPQYKTDGLEPFNSEYEGRDSVDHWNEPESDSNRDSDSEFGLDSEILAARLLPTINSQPAQEPERGEYEQYMDPEVDALIATHPNPLDRLSAATHHPLGKITWDQAVRSQPDWVWVRVRRYIPPSDYLEPVLEKLLKSHANLICSKHGITLFNGETHKAAQAMLEDVRRGWLTDPPGIALYNRLRTDKNGLSVHHCNRGTNDLEGGVHMPLQHRFGSLGASVELSVALLSDFCYRKNVESLPFDSPRKTRPEYLNVSLFKPTHKSFIVTPLAQTVRDKYDIPRHAQPSSGGRMLGIPLDTKFAVTPIHTNEEHSLFNKALRPSSAFSAATGAPNFNLMAKWWSERVDGKKIFFKLPEHFQAHFKTWNALRTELTTMQLTERNRAEFMDIGRSDAHTSLVLDESYSPVVHGRRAIGSSAKIAV